MSSLPVLAPWRWSVSGVVGNLGLVWILAWWCLCQNVVCPTALWASYCLLRDGDQRYLQSANDERLSLVALLLFPVEVIMTDNVSVRSTPNGDRLVDFFLHGMELLLTAGLLSSLPIGQQLTWSAGMLKGNGHHLSSHRLVYFHIIWGHSRPLPRAFLGCRLVFIFFPLHVGMLHGTFPPQWILVKTAGIVFVLW